MRARNAAVGAKAAGRFDPSEALRPIPQRGVRPCLLPKGNVQPVERTSKNLPAVREACSSRSHIVDSNFPSFPSTDLPTLSRTGSQHEQLKVFSWEPWMDPLADVRADDIRPSGRILVGSGSVSDVRGVGVGGVLHGFHSSVRRGGDCLLDGFSETVRPVVARPPSTIPDVDGGIRIPDKSMYQCKACGAWNYVEDMEKDEAMGDENEKEPLTIKTEPFAEVKANCDAIAEKQLVDRPGFLLEEVTNEMRDRQMVEPAKWTLNVGQFIEIMNWIKKDCRYEEEQEKFGGVNMYRINDLFIKPWTAGHGCGLSIRRSREFSQPAKVMLSHAWGEDAEELLDCVEKYNPGRKIDSLPLWFCCFANYQAEDIEEVKIKKLLALDPFAQVIKQLKFDDGWMLAIHTTKEDLYKRLWCVYEIDHALEEDVRVQFSVSQKYELEVADKMKRLLRCNADKQTFDHAARIRITSAAATCSCPSDEQYIFERILQGRGFQNLDDTISEFRKKVLRDIFMKECKNNYDFLKYAEPDVMLDVVKAEVKKADLTQHSGQNRATLKSLHAIPLDQWKEPDFMRQVLDVAPHAKMQIPKYHLTPYEENVVALKDKVGAIESLLKDGKLLAYVEEALRMDIEVVQAALKSHPHALQYAAEELRKNKQVVIVALQLNGFALEHAAVDLRKDREVVLEAVKNDGRALKFAGRELRKDEGVVIEALKSNIEAAIYVDTFLWAQLRRNTDQIGPIVEKDWKTLTTFDPEIRADKNVMLVAIKQSEEAFLFATDALQIERKFVLEAVAINRKVLKHVKKELLGDREFVLEVIAVNGNALQYASEELQADRLCVLEAVKSRGRSLQYASKELKADRLCVLEAVKSHGLSLEYASKDLRADKEVVLEAVKQAGTALQFAEGSDPIKAMSARIDDSSCTDDYLEAFRSDIFLGPIVKVEVMATHFSDQEWGSTKANIFLSLYFGDECLARTNVFGTYRTPECKYGQSTSRTFTDDAIQLKADRGCHYRVEYTVGGGGGHSIHIRNLCCRVYPSSLRGDRDVVLAAIKQNGLALEYASEALRSDKDCVLEALKHDSGALCYASEDLRKDRAVVLEAVKERGRSLEYASQDLRADREVVLAAIRQDGAALNYAAQELGVDWEVVIAVSNNLPQGEAIHFVSSAVRDKYDTLIAVKQGKKGFLEFAPSELRAESSVMLEAVEQDGMALEYASETLRADRAVVLRAVKSNGLALKHASSALRADWKVVREAVEQAGVAFEHASEELRADREVVLAALKLSGDALEYASQELRADREVVLAAIQSSGNALKHASEELCNDRAVVLEAVKQSGLSLKHASEDLREDRELVLEAVKQNGSALQYASPELKKEKAVVLQAVKQNGCALLHAFGTLKDDEEVVLEAIKTDGRCLEYASEKLRSRRKVVLSAIKQCGSALEYASEALRADWDLVIVACKDQDRALRFASEGVRKKYETLVAVRKHGKLLKNASEQLRADREVVLAAVTRCGMALEYASKELRADKEVVQKAIKQNRDALRWASKELRETLL